MRLKSKNIVPMAIGAIMILLSATVLFIDNPFKPRENLSQFISVATESNIEKIDEEESGKAVVNTTIYGTEYGDKVTTADSKKIIQKGLDKIFNVSYRTVKQNPEAFEKEMQKYVDWVSYDFKRDENGENIYDLIPSISFTHRVATAIANNDVEMAVKFEPEYEYQDMDKYFTYVNGKLSVTFFNGKDLSDFKDIFGLDSAELNKEYVTDFCFRYYNEPNHSDSSELPLTFFIPHYVAVKDS